MKKNISFSDFETAVKSTLQSIAKKELNIEFSYIQNSTKKPVLAYSSLHQNNKIEPQVNFIEQAGLKNLPIPDFKTYFKNHAHFLHSNLYQSLTLMQMHSSKINPLFDKKEPIHFSKNKSPFIPIPIPDQFRKYHIKKTRQIFRGYTDRYALLYRYHNSNIHNKLRPESTISAILFDILELVRTEAIGAKEFKGIEQNLNMFQKTESKKYQYHRHSENNLFPVIDALALRIQHNILRKKSVSSDRQALFSFWQSFLDQYLCFWIDQMVASCQDQTLYSKYSLTCIEQLIGKDQKTLSSTKKIPDSLLSQKEKTIQSNPLRLDTDQNTPHQAGSKQEADSLYSQNIIRKDQSTTKQEDETNLLSPSHVNLTPLSPYEYCIYTKEYDEIIYAEKLVKSKELHILNQKLETYLEACRKSISKLACQIRKTLTSYRYYQWDFNLEEGILDNSRLSHIIMDPTYPLGFKKENISPSMDTIVSLLIDNSGSMRGKPIIMAALCANVLAKTLEKCGVKSEILGFTTKNWRGGCAKQDWLKKHKPENPGRLNDLRHIIYKSAHMPWIRTHKNLGIMLKEGLLKENIDGEALLWAQKRLLSYPEKRKILLVISDGAPVDDATLSANITSPTYLETHLYQVINEIEQTSNIELSAIGIGHDVTHYYPHSIMIDDIQHLAQAIGKKLSQIFIKTGIYSTIRKQIN